jgi:hypothetical protein
MYLRRMKYFFLFALIVFGSASCTRCLEGLGTPLEERRTLEAFEAVTTSGNFHVVLNQIGVNEQAYVVIYAPPNIIPNIESTITGGTLNLSAKDCYTSSEQITIQVFTPSYKRITSEGTGNVTAATSLIGEKLSIANEGTGEMNLPANFIEIKIDNAGTGSIRLKGETKDLEINNQGTGDVLVDELRANHAKVSNQGTGNVYLQALQSIDVQLQGTGNVIYSGDPQDIQQSNEGTGTIERK